MSKAVQETLESNLIQIIKQITSSKQEELDAMKKQKDEAEVNM